MAAVAQRDSSEDHFVGQVLVRASPVLTWRPVKVQRITPTPKAPEEVVVRTETDSTIFRISRVPTRRVVAWPVVPRLARTRSGARRALLAKLAIALVAGSALALAAFVVLGAGAGTALAKPPTVRVATVHVIDDGFDLLSAQQEAALAGVVVDAIPAAPVRQAPHRDESTQAAARRGRAHHGHRRIAGTSH